MSKRTQEEVEEDFVEIATKPTSTGPLKQKVLAISTRSVNARNRHLLEDLRSLMPHSKKEAKVESKNMGAIANDMAEMAGCNKILIFETKRKQDLFVHMACSPTGPTAKFLALNVHTMLELNFSGNHLKGSRPIVSFDGNFTNDGEPHLVLIKEILKQMFSTPRRHKRSKPFVDHIITFSRLGVGNEASIYMRNYQIAHSAEGPDVEPQLIEVGPRLTLEPVQVFEGSMRGATLWKNASFVAPNVERRNLEVEKADMLQASRKKTKKGKEHMKRWSIPESQLDQVMRGAEFEEDELPDNIDIE